VQQGKKEISAGLQEEIKAALETYKLDPQAPVEHDEAGDDLIPSQPIGRLVTKGTETCLEYDPEDAPEFISDEHGTGKFTWEPLTPEGFEMRPSEYTEEAVPVPADRVFYLQGAGFLQADEDEDYRAYIDPEVTVAHGRKWQRVVLKGHQDGVRAGLVRLMAGVLRRRPWERPADPELPKGDAADAQMSGGITDVLLG